MAQSDVIELLKVKKGKWLDSKEISKHLKISINCVSSNLMRLRLYNMINYRVIQGYRGQGRYLYQYKEE